MAVLVTDTPSCALAIYAHPDDADISCGGTLARWTSDGARVELVVCARGDKGAFDAGTDPDELARRRASELSKSVATLGVDRHRVLGYPDGELENDVGLRRQLVAVIREVKPEAVVCPDPMAAFFGEEYFNHRDHRVVGWASLDSVSPAAAIPLYFPEVGPAHQVSTVYMSGTLDPDVWVDVSATVETKAEALLHHQSQVGERSEWFRAAVRTRAEEAGRQAGVRYAEGFRRLRVKV